MLLQILKLPALKQLFKQLFFLLNLLKQLFIYSSNKVPTLGSDACLNFICKQK